MRSTLIYAGLYVGLVAAACAQTGNDANKPPLPAGGIPLKPADMCAWQINYAYSGETPRKPTDPPPTPPAIRPGFISIPTAPPRQVTLTYTKPIWHAFATNVDGRKLDEWSDGQGHYYKADGSPNVAPVPTIGMGHTLMFPNYSQAVFKDMQWVSEQTYTGVASAAGHQCFVFRNGDMTAWFDRQSLAPVQWQNAAETRTFAQLSPPGDKLVFPPEFAKVSNQLNRYFQNLQRNVPH